MKLKFIGRGAQSFYGQGNTSAYFIEDGNLYLIDCGTNIIERLQLSGILEQVKSINFFNTHTHDDHIGSVGSLAMDAQYKLKIPMTFYHGSDTKHDNDIFNILKAYQVEEKVRFANIRTLDDKQQTFNSARYVPTEHSAGMPSYGLQFETKDGIVYHSGDTNQIDQIADIGKEKKLRHMYVDGTTKKSPVHISIPELDERLPHKNREEKFTVMHFKDHAGIADAKRANFGIAKVERSVTDGMLRAAMAAADEKLV